MPLLLWIALIVLLFVSTVGAVHVFLRLRNFWHTFKSFGSALDVTVRELTGSVERLAGNAGSFESATQRLDPSLERLRRSLARAAVLRAAVQDAQDAFGRLTAVYPRK
jgi:biopolymer transport protein ExbB/TolQ